MSDFKKVILDPQTQEKLWKLIHDEEEVLTDIMGAEVKLTKLSTLLDDQHEVIREIESDPELQKMLSDSEMDEKAGRIYSADEAIQFIKEHSSR